MKNKSVIINKKCIEGKPMLETCIKQSTALRDHYFDTTSLLKLNS